MAAPEGNNCEQVLLKVADMLPKEWEKLAIHCGFSCDEIDTFSVDAAFKMLCSQRKKKPASLRKTLIKSLKAIGRNDVVKLVKKQRFLTKEEMKSSKSKTGTVRQPNSAKPSTQQKKEMKSSKSKTGTVRQPNSAKPSTQQKKEMSFRSYKIPPNEIRSAVTEEGIDVYYDKGKSKSNLKRLNNGSWHFRACLTCVLADLKEKTVLTHFFMKNEERGKQVHQMIQETSSAKHAKLTCLTVVKPEKRGTNYTLKFNENSAISM